MAEKKGFDTRKFLIDLASGGQTLFGNKKEKDG